MAEEARRRIGKGTGKEGSEGSHPFKGKGKSPGKAQQKGGKGKSGPGGSPAAPSAVRLDLLLEAAYQLYIAGRRADQPRVSRNAWLRNNMRSDSALRAELRERMRAAHHVETVESPTSPAVVEVCAESSQSPFQVQSMANILDSTPPASERSSDQLPPEQQSLQVPAGGAAEDAGHTAESGSTAAAPPAREAYAAGEPKPPQAAEGSASEAAIGAPHCGPSGQALGSLEVECREALRTQWLSFPFDPEATAASTLAHCRAAASMALPSAAIAAGIATKGCGVQDSVVLQLDQLRNSLSCAAYAYAEWGPHP
eukprot:s9330_g2.t1